MDISILICTYNRAEELRLTLAGIGKLVIPADTRWELLIADNNSTDNTRDIVSSFEGSLPIRYLVETKQGKSHALNSGVKECLAPLILMTDDDVDLDPNWVVEVYRAASARPESHFFGGRIVPRWPGKPPAWLVPHSQDLLLGITLDFTLGDEDAVLKLGGNTFLGANIAFRKQALLEVGSFRGDLGPHGRALRFGEESEYIERLIHAGYQGYYLPRMIVYHRNAAERMTERYMLRWFAASGVCDVRAGVIWPADPTLFGAPRYLWRQLIVSFLSYAARRLTGRTDKQWIKSAISMARAWGAISEYRRMTEERRRQDRILNHAT
jgi:glycosyltransferase involved in cell wall biosynthesis